MKPYEEIDFPNGFLRWIREDGEYVCRMTEEQMEKMKVLHEAPYKAPRTWAGLTEAQCGVLWKVDMTPFAYYQAIEAKLKEKNA
jgi:hypothetical protein